MDAANGIPQMAEEKKYELISPIDYVDMSLLPVYYGLQMQHSSTLRQW